VACAWWLTHIEKEVSSYLTSIGAQPSNDFLPSEYLEVPPDNIALVRKQSLTLREILDSENDHFYQFIEKTTKYIQETKINGLMQEMEYVLSGAWRQSFPEIEMSELEAANIRSDWRYLKKMISMDDEITALKKREGKLNKKQIVMSAVVPISGLVLARFHVMLCELTTVLDVWDRPPQPPKQNVKSLFRQQTADVILHHPPQNRLTVSSISPVGATPRQHYEEDEMNMPISRMRVCARSPTRRFYKTKESTDSIRNSGVYSPLWSTLGGRRRVESDKQNRSKALPRQNPLTRPNSPSLSIEQSDECGIPLQIHEICIPKSSFSVKDRDETFSPSLPNSPRRRSPFRSRRNCAGERHTGSAVMIRPRESSAYILEERSRSPKLYRSSDVVSGGDLSVMHLSLDPEANAASIIGDKPLSNSTLGFSKSPKEDEKSKNLEQSHPLSMNDLPLRQKKEKTGKERYFSVFSPPNVSTSLMGQSGTRSTLSLSPSPTNSTTSPLKLIVPSPPSPTSPTSPPSPNTSLASSTCDTQFLRLSVRTTKQKRRSPTLIGLVHRTASQSTPESHERSHLHDNPPQTQRGTKSNSITPEPFQHKVPNADSFLARLSEFRKIPSYNKYFTECQNSLLSNYFYRISQMPPQREVEALLDTLGPTGKKGITLTAEHIQNWFDGAAIFFNDKIWIAQISWQYSK
jgi:hypothetical protein